ncbi:MAG: putative nicotinate-nucleotide adenylyltransferase [Acidimicrobiales bacterium]|nr:MAG: putative nicotinate-nucleotide adenylyltransferase [Acidimicrobiales bacterium]
MFGGTFDPPHVGHLVAAVNVRHELALDRVLFVVANRPWQKEALRHVSPADARLEMVAAAIAGVDGLELCTLEVDRGGVSYTADTLAELTDIHPYAELFLVLGRDAAAGLPTWERVEEVKRLASLVVVDRPGVCDPLPSGFAFQSVQIPRIDLSSTDLRRRVAEGRPLDFLVPPKVVDVIRRRGLYTESS